MTREVCRCPVALLSVVLALACSGADLRGQDAELAAAFLFGSRGLSCPVPGRPDVSYTVVLHVGGEPLALAYPDPTIQLAVGQAYPDPGRTWGYEVFYQDLFLGLVDDPDIPPSPFGERSGFEMFGPFDNSPNNRDELGDDLDPCGTSRIYDSFIGTKDYFMPCNAETVGDPDLPCSTVMEPEGIIFRVDVPNGYYRFVAAVGESYNTQAHRIVVEDGGAGPPSEIGPRHVVLVHNFDQAQYTIGQTSRSPGAGVYARVGFDDKLPPGGDGVFPDPQFINMDSQGRATSGAPDSPTLEVSEGYLRVHQLQANTNEGPGGDSQPYAAALVLLEIWEVPEPPLRPEECSDLNGDGTVNVGDPVVLLRWLFLGGPPPTCPGVVPTCGDVTGDATVDVEDVIRILNWLFVGDTSITCS